MEYLKSTDNSPEVQEDVDSLFFKLEETIHGEPDCLHSHFEHGQWWVTCLCGAAWSVVDCVLPNGVECLDLEQVSNGDEDYHRE